MTNEEIVKKIRLGINVTDNMALLYNQNKGLIFSIAKKYSSYLPVDDLTQEGYLALYNAVNNYESDLEVKFSTYAIYWIRNAMQKCIENQAFLFHIPRELNHKINLYKSVIHSYEMNLGRKPTDAELCTHLGINKNRLTSVKGFIEHALNTSSLDAPINDESLTELGDTIPSNENFEEAILDTYEKQALAELWKIVKDNTNELENRIIELKYKQNKTVKEIANILNVSESFVRQGEIKAMKKLRKTRLLQLFRDKFDSLGSLPVQSGLQSFNHTWTSSTERSALKLYDIK